MAQATELAERLAFDLDRAFPELVTTYQDRLYSGVRAFVGSADAEDVTQEALIRAHRALQRYEPARIAQLKLSAWLWTIAINLCRNWARSRSRRPRTVELQDAAAPESSADDTAVAGAMLETWRERLACLSEAQRTAVVMRHVVGLGYAEIAEATGRPVGTAKADVSRGLAALRTILINEGEAA